MIQIRLIGSGSDAQRLVHEEAEFIFICIRVHPVWPSTQHSRRRNSSSTCPRRYWLTLPLHLLNHPFKSLKLFVDSASHPRRRLPLLLPEAGPSPLSWSIWKTATTWGSWFDIECLHQRFPPSLPFVAKDGKSDQCTGEQNADDDGGRDVDVIWKSEQPLVRKTLEEN